MSSTGSWPIQLVQSDERQYNGTWSPDGKWIVFQQDTGGNELWNIFAVPSDGGEVINVTHTPDIREESPRWSPNGKTIALNYKPKELGGRALTPSDAAAASPTRAHCTANFATVANSCLAMNQLHVVALNEGLRRKKARCGRRVVLSWSRSYRLRGPRVDARTCSTYSTN
ncbi:MAG TPA: hypothetical protein VMX38_20380 [Verrucomicrobiae bacterium]|nr:hypothetical protein [Verrucomicrobiae bacterium]